MNHPPLSPHRSIFWGQTGRSHRLVPLETRNAPRDRTAFEVTCSPSKHEQVSLVCKGLCALLLKNVHIPALVHQSQSSCLQWAPIELATQLYEQISKGHEEKKVVLSHYRGKLSHSLCQNASFPMRTHCDFCLQPELTFPSSGAKRSSTFCCLPQNGAKASPSGEQHVLRWALALRSHCLETVMLLGPTELGLLPAGAKIQPGKSPIPSAAQKCN